MTNRNLLALAICIAFAGPAASRDIYVNNQLGDDHKGGTVQTPQGQLGPCRTIAKALRIAKASDRIVLANTGIPYRESITLQGARHSGSDRFPFVLVGNGATLDGVGSLEDAAWQYVAHDTFRTAPQPMSFQQLFLDDQPAKKNQPRPGQPPQLAPREWCEINGWIHFRVDAHKLPQSYNLSYCALPVGITLYDVHDVIIEDLTIRRFQLDGINCHDNVRRSDLVRLTATENGRSGLSIGGSCRVRIDSCQASGNGVAQARTEGYCAVELIANTFDPTSAPALTHQGGRLIQSPEPRLD